MDSTQTGTDFTLEIEDIKNKVMTFAAAVGQDIKSIREGMQLGSYTLTGLNVSLSGQIVETDNALQAFGRIQNQINNLPTVADYTLTGLITNLTGKVTATDNILQAFGRVQNQINNLPTTSQYTLSGLNTSLSGSVLSTDNILQAFGRVQNQINNLPPITINKYVLTASADINNLTGSGFYTASGSVPALANNFPVEEAGCLNQIVFGTNKTQEYLTVTGLKFIRGYDGTNWSNWREV